MRRILAADEPGRPVRTRIVTCTACASPWWGSSSRFCGTCGAPLARPSRTFRPGGRSSAGRLLLAASVLPVVAFAILATNHEAVSPDGPIGGGDVVSLPPSPRADHGPELRSSQQGQPRPPVPCDARGCLASDAGGRLTIAISQAEKTVVAIDAATGALRWTASLPDGSAFEHRALHTGSPGRAVRQLPSIGDGVHLAGPGWVAVLDEDGNHLWTAASPTYPNYVRRTAAVALFHASIPDQGGRQSREHLAAHDAFTGELLWERQVARLQLLHLDRDIIVVTTQEGRLTALQQRTGETLWETEGASAELSPRNPSALDVILADGTTTTVGIATGRVSDVHRDTAAGH